MIIYNESGFDLYKTLIFCIFEKNCANAQICVNDFGDKEQKSLFFSGGGVLRNQVFCCLIAQSNLNIFIR